MSPLHVASFAGGVVRTGSPDAQQTDELLVADAVDIGPRGQLVCASDVSAYTTIQGGASGVALTELYGLVDAMLGLTPQTFCWGRGRNDANNADAGVLGAFARATAPATINAGTSFGLGLTANTFSAPPANGLILTGLQVPGTFTIAGTSGSLILLCAGAREGDYPRVSGAQVIAVLASVGSSFSFYTMSHLDALGTGSASSSFAGNKGSDLFFRGIVGYNNHVFGWGFDAVDATNGNGPARVMFSNPGDPRKWGNDNQADSGNRFYTDSDAIVLGDAGEIVRGAVKWNGRLYFGTNQQLHYIAGFGRDSYVTDGANPVAKSYNIIGPKALIEGPDRLLYQVSDQGLVAHDGASFEPHFKRLVDFAGHSSGFWDLIWTDPTRSAGYPGKTNQDLVWMAVDWDREQVLVGIPFCNASSGAGVGTDTVVVKFHTRSGGFTRQVFPGVAFTAAGYFARQGQQREARFLATGTGGQATIQRYAYQATQTTSPVLPAQLPVVRFGPYAPFGSDGQGGLRRAYLTLAWESVASLPIVFTVQVRVDETVSETFTVSVQASAPGSPVDGDVWLDTSQSDTSLGNATAGTSIAALGGYLVKTWSATRAAWRQVPGSGESGTRAMIPMPLTRRVSTRVTMLVTTVSAAGRFQVEGLGLNPGGGQSDA